MAKLFFRYSTMNAGKSMDLLKTNFNYEENNVKTLCLTSAKDNRYGLGKIASRIGISTDATMISDDINIYELVKEKIGISCVLIDEVQFFTKEQVFQMADIVDILDIPVIAYGLRSDFQLNPFPASSYLMTIADEITELKTICACCKSKKAIVNARYIKNEFHINKYIVLDGDQVMVGGNDSYVPLCRKCFKETIEINKKMRVLDDSIIPEGMYCYTPKEHKNGVLKTKQCPYFDFKVYEDEIGKIYTPHCHYLQESSIPAAGWKNNEFERLMKILNLTVEGMWEEFSTDLMLWDRCKICGINDDEHIFQEYIAPHIEL